MNASPPSRSVPATTDYRRDSTAHFRAVQRVVRRSSRVWTAAALLALAACGPGAEPGNQVEPKAQSAQGASPPPVQAPAGKARRPYPVPAEAGGGAAPAPSATAARRCGWLHNPTPGNWWLEDRDGQWVLASQGGRRAEGMEEMPDMSAAGWQEVNGYYGYGCACLRLTVEPGTGDVLAVAAPEPKPLAVCRADRALPRP